MAVCSKCAATVPDEAKFCPACGQAIVTVDVQPVIPEPAPSQYQAETILPQEEQILQQSYYAEPQNPAPQQSYYAQPTSPAQPQNPVPQQSYYAQQTSAVQPPQQSYYAGQQNQPPQQNYYAPQQAPNSQQSYYAQQQAPNPQQSYYAQQQNPNQQQNNYGYQQNYQQPRPVYQAGPQDVEENKGICVLCYLGILLLIPLLSKPNSQFVKYHSNQGLVLLIMGIAVGILTMIPYLGWFVIGPLGYIFTLVCIIIGIINAVGGQMKPLPLIGKISLIK